MKKIRYDIAGYLLLLLLAGMLLFHMCRISNQSFPASVLKVDFVGEYRQGDGEWKTLESGTRISALDGDLILRGKLSESLAMMKSFYLNHIGIRIFVDGQEVFASGRFEDGIPEMACGSYWGEWFYDEEDWDGEMEIHLHNPHAYGNADAYNEFLDSLYLGGGMVLQKAMEKDAAPVRVAGLFVMVVAVALLGISAYYAVWQLPSSGLLCSLALSSLGMSGYLIMDAPAISFQSKVDVFNTCMLLFCVMLAALALSDSVRRTLPGSVRRNAGILTALLVLGDGILLALSLAERISPYDMGYPWAILQGVVFAGLLVLCIKECSEGERQKRIIFLSYIILLLTALLELLNGWMNWWKSGIVVKIVFLQLFLFHLIWAVRVTAANQRASRKAKELEGELKHSRIVLAMSQIRTHFIFNILTAISGMCEYDPKKADETILRFSRYLRSNIDIMEEDCPETFERSMKHLEDYVALEQIRFGDRIRFEKDLEITNFKIPPLILQPVVENGIRHGLLPRASGGTIFLRTRKEKDQVVITIADDGVGFEPGEEKKDGSVGLSNVRFRLSHMMNGRLEIESSPGQGTKVTITIPCKEAEL